MMTTPRRLCPICDGARAEVIHTQRFALPEQHPLSSGYDVVSCELCGFVYADTQVTQLEYDDFYASLSKYEDPEASTGGGCSHWDARRLGETAEVIAAAIRSADARILDIGCANGGLLLALKRLGFKNLVGLDPSPGCVANTRRKGIEARLGSLQRLPFERTQFDCLILSHVLEHVQDLRVSLANLARLTQEDSLLYVEVPDATRYRDFNYAPFQDFNTEHINHFSDVFLCRLLERFGFAPVKVDKKTICLSENQYYPAVFGIYENRARRFATSWCKDTILSSEIRRYIVDSERLLRKIETHLASCLQYLPEVIIWGTGQLAMKLLAGPAFNKVRIVACVDSNPVYHGRSLGGAPIVPPNKVGPTKTPIVITTLLHDREIVENIRALGLDNDLVFLGPTSSTMVQEVG